VGFNAWREAVCFESADMEYLSTGIAFSIEKARARFGYEPLVDQEEGIRRSVK
jgi:nucleoside-diphosphate-sugar epimerase